MIRFRRLRLTGVLVCVQGLGLAGEERLAQTRAAPAPSSPRRTPPADPAPTPAPPRPQSNPFEIVPETRPRPRRPPSPAPGRTMNTNQAGLVERIEFRGARRVPADTLRALIFTKPGDLYRRRSAAPRFHGALEHQPLRRHPAGSRDRRTRRRGSSVSSSPSGPSSAPSNMRATSRYPLRKFWTDSRNAKSGSRSNRSTIRPRCSTRPSC